MKLILPVPLAPKPIAVLLFFQLYVAPATGPDNVILFVDSAQITRLVTAVTLGIGFTLIVNVSVAPEHVNPPDVNVGVTTIVAVIGAFVVLVAVKLAMLPGSAETGAHPQQLAVLGGASQKEWSGGSTHNPANGGFPGRTFPAWAWYERDTSASPPPKVIFIVSILPFGFAARQSHSHRSCHI